MYNTIRSTAAKYNSIALNYLNVYGLSSTASVILGSLSNDGNENSNKPIGIDWQNNNFARASRVFVHLLAVVARLQRESAWIHVLSRTGIQDNNFLFFSWTLIQSFRIELQKHLSTIDEVKEME